MMTMTSLTLVTDIATECLKDMSILADFWLGFENLYLDTQPDHRIGLYKFLDQLLMFFPYQCEELV